MRKKIIAVSLSLILFFIPLACQGKKPLAQRYRVGWIKASGESGVGTMLWEIKEAEEFIREMDAPGVSDGTIHFLIPEVIVPQPRPEINSGQTLEKLEI